MIIHHLIEQQAQRQPDTIALVSEDRALSYRELNQAANRMAWSLVQRGIGVEQFVAVDLERSIEAVVVMLGILKAGAAWIYLDPSLPQVRREAILHDAQPTALITLDDPGFSHTGPTQDPAVPVTPDIAACLLYTSGSTGQPKGAVAIHRSLTARLEFGPLPDITPDDVCVLNSSLAFGMTASRMLLPLAVGARLIVPPERDVRDIMRFAKTLTTHRVTSVFLPPALLRALLELDSPTLAALSHVRAVSLAGSAVTPEVIRAFFQAFPKALLVNLYGSTEIGSTASLSVMTAASHGNASADTISIGRPMPSVTMCILDDNMRPAPDGDPGELYVGTPYLAREYLHQPGLTAERFLTNPFGPGDANARIYKTGDLARRLPSGEIQLAGRRDHQVKIRGHRIELGEVEAALEHHTDVHEAVVTVQEELLIAYVVPTRNATLTITSLQAYVREHLPHPMHPSAYLILPKLPRTAGGKVDRGSLPSRDPARPPLDSPYEPPRNSLEAELVRIWSAALKIRQIGVHDNFLDLGGDSLAAIHVLVQLEQRFEPSKIPLTMDVLFDRTIADLARGIDTEVLENRR